MCWDYVLVGGGWGEGRGGGSHGRSLHIWIEISQLKILKEIAKFRPNIKIIASHRII
jgi:hypothetical protein